MMDADDLPDGWAVAKVGEIAASIQSGFACGAHNRDGRGTIHLRPMNITADGLLSLEDVRHVEGECPHKVEVGDVLFNNTNSAELVGKTALIRESSGYAFSNHMTRIRCKPVIEPAFLAIQLNTMFRSGYFQTRCNNHVSQASISASYLRDEVDLAIPPLAEQRRIVAKIEELTARSRAAREALAEVPTLLEQFRQSVLASAFRGDLTADWRAKNPTAEPASVLLDRIRAERRKQWETRYPKKKYVAPEPVDDSDLPELPEGWCWASVDELAEVQLGQRRAPEYIGKAEYAYIRSANITWEGLDLTDVKRMGFDDAEPLLLRRGDILLNEASGSPTEVGKPALWNDEIPACCLQATVLRLRGNSTEVSPLWLFYHSLRDALLAEYAAKCPGLGIIHLTAKLLRKWPVALAPLAEQTEIIRRLDLAEQQRRSTASAVSVALQDHDALDQSILAKAFRGELVPQDPADEPAAVLLERLRAAQAESSANGTPRRKVRK